MSHHPTEGTTDPTEAERAAAWAAYYATNPEYAAYYAQQYAAHYPQAPAEQQQPVALLPAAPSDSTTPAAAEPADAAAANSSAEEAAVSAAGAHPAASEDSVPGLAPEATATSEAAPAAVAPPAADAQSAAPPGYPGYYSYGYGAPGYPYSGYPPAAGYGAPSPYPAAAPLPAAPSEPQPAAPSLPYGLAPPPPSATPVMAPPPPLPTPPPASPYASGQPGYNPAHPLMRPPPPAGSGGEAVPEKLPPQPGQEEFYRRPDNWPGRGYLVRYVGEAIHRAQNIPLNIRHDLLIERRVIGRLLGKGGRDLEAMQLCSGAEIFIIDKYPPPGEGDDHRLLVIIGQPEQVRLAQALPSQASSARAPEPLPLCRAPLVMWSLPGLAMTLAEFHPQPPTPDVAGLLLPPFDAFPSRHPQPSPQLSPRLPPAPQVRLAKSKVDVVLARAREELPPLPPPLSSGYRPVPTVGGAEAEGGQGWMTVANATDKRPREEDGHEREGSRARYGQEDGRGGMAGVMPGPMPGPPPPPPGWSNGPPPPPSREHDERREYGYDQRGHEYRPNDEPRRSYAPPAAPDYSHPESSYRHHERERELQPYPGTLTQYGRGR